MGPEAKKPIKSFRDLEVYQSSYEAVMLVFRELLPRLPEKEKFDLKDQLSRSTKAAPRLIAEGYAKNTREPDFRSI